MAVDNAAAYRRWTQQTFGIGGDVENAALDTKRRIFRDAFNDLVKESPWRTGRFRASWRVANGSPNPTSEPDGKPHYRTPGAEVLEPVLAFMKLNTPAFITNNVPYARRLAFGWSKQQSSGWVSRAVKRAVAKARGQ